MSREFFFELLGKNLTSKDPLAQKVDLKMLNVEIFKAVY